MHNDPDRRRFLRATLAATLMAPVAAGPLAALTTPEARRLIDRLVSEINAVIDSGARQDQMYRRFEDVLRRYADMNIVARSVLGAEARSASPEQLRAFTDAFTGYLSRKYGKRFHEFVGGRLEVTGAREVRGLQEVTALARLPGEEPFEVVFLVSDKSGQQKFFNMYVEGVNMVASERSEIGAMLDRRGGNLDSLISHLRSAG